MPASLSAFLCSLPSLPLPTTTRPSHFSPLPWRLPTDRADGFLPISVKNPRLQIFTEKDATLRSCCPSLAWANVLFAKSGCYNVQVVVGEDEPEEVLLRRFRREVMRAGVIQECRRRRFFENMQEKKKRKTREAARRNRRRRYTPKALPKDKQDESDNKKDEEEEDNWELPEGELPY
ncbi:small ribosomal subunit protein bS21c-like [Typha latifolia]|uniref:small ribosomal subunit protein bS21c-like n=1 Tax=Typha latifolia TaxID=4733 RepID=UPI003C2AD600